MSGKRWQNYCTLFEDVRDKFRKFLGANGIYYECSTGFFGFEFEVKASNEQFVCADEHWLYLHEHILDIEDLYCPEFDCEVA